MNENPLSQFELAKAIELRWALRDIIGDRLKLTPLQDHNLQTLIELDLVEIRDDAPVVTTAGIAALER